MCIKMLEELNIIFKTRYISNLNKFNKFTFKKQKKKNKCTLDL